MESCSERRSNLALFNTLAVTGLLVESARGLKAFSPGFVALQEAYPRSCANPRRRRRKPGAWLPAQFHCSMTWTGEAVNQENSPSGAENPERRASRRWVRDLAC